MTGSGVFPDNLSRSPRVVMNMRQGGRDEKEPRKSAGSHVTADHAVIINQVMLAARERSGVVVGDRPATENGDGPGEEHTQVFGP